MPVGTSLLLTQPMPLVSPQEHSQPVCTCYLGHVPVRILIKGAYRSSGCLTGTSVGLSPSSSSYIDVQRSGKPVFCLVNNIIEYIRIYKSFVVNRSILVYNQKIYILISTFFAYDISYNSI